MSLTKKRTMSETRKAASRANARRSRGPATPEGRERIRAANLHHGSRLESASYREIMRISNLLLKGDQPKQNGDLPGYPQNMLKTKGEKLPLARKHEGEADGPVGHA